jgi:hypothetical protein
MRQSYARAQGLGLGFAPGQRAKPAYRERAWRVRLSLVPAVTVGFAPAARYGESSSFVPGLVGHPHTRNRSVMIVSIHRSPDLPRT